MARNYIGVDISKDWLDICDPRRGETRIDNTAPALRRWLQGLDQGGFLILEATSRCDKLLRAQAAAAGVGYARLNPLHSWYYAQSHNLAKTDRVDARMLARLGAERQPEPTPETDPARAELGLLNQRRDQLLRMRTQEKNRLGDTAHPLLVKDIQASLKALARRIAQIEAAIRDHLGRNPELDTQARLLCTIPGVGRVTAVEILAHLPQLGRIDRRGIAQLGGLAPRAKDSGQRKGQRRLAPGRRHVRKALYMAALSGLRHPDLFGGLARRMRAAGKAGKVIAIAIARKILTIANAIIRTGEPFRAN